MVQVTFTKDMLKILSELKGAIFLAYECRNEIDKPVITSVYGDIRIHTSKGSVELKNEDELFPFFGGEDEIARLSCRKLALGEPYVTMDTSSPLEMIKVGEKITGVEVINDIVKVGDGVYDVTVDLAVVIRTETKTYMFARDIWFSEVLTIAEHDDYEKVYPIEETKYDWSDYGDYEVDIKRTRLIL